MKLLIFLLIAGVFITQGFCRSIQCDCDCKSKPQIAICGKEPKTGDVDTFLNMCQMQCYNCTHSKNYYVILQGDCDSKKAESKPKINVSLNNL